MDRGIYSRIREPSIQRFNDSTIQRPLLGAIGQDQCRFTVLQPTTLGPISRLLTYVN